MLENKMKEIKSDFKNKILGNKLKQKNIRSTWEKIGEIDLHFYRKTQ